MSDRHQRFRELEERYSRLFMNGKPREAIEIAEKLQEEYPERKSNTGVDLALMYKDVGEEDEAVEVLTTLLEEGYWFPKGYFPKVFEREDFEEKIQCWKRLKEEAKKESEGNYIVQEPETDREEKGLFIGLHGRGENADFFSWKWSSEKIEEEYLRIYPQSSQMIGSGMCCWDNRELAYDEIEDIYEGVKGEHSQFDKKSIIGGFSQGGGLSIDLAMNEDHVPVDGFIAVCPPVPNSITQEVIEQAVKDGKRGVIITGTEDQVYTKQMELKELFEESGFPHKFMVIDGMQHWFPEDLPAYLDKALKFIE